MYAVGMGNIESVSCLLTLTGLTFVSISFPRVPRRLQFVTALNLDSGVS